MFMKHVIRFGFLITFVSMHGTFNSCKKTPEPILVYNDYVVPQEVLEESFRLGARSTALIANKSVITRTIKLPPRTVYWSYWMGVGPEPVAALSKVVVPLVASKFTKDPFVAHAWGLLGTLNLFNNGTQNADLFFMETSQGLLFSFKDSSFTTFIAKPQTKNVHDKYIDILDTPADKNNTFTVGIRNQNYTAGVDVKMKVWAFVVKPF